MEVHLKRKKADPVNLLSLIPVRKAGWEKNEKGLIILLKPKWRLPLLRKHLLPRLKRPCYKVNLDAIGSFLWEACDGERDVEELGRLLFQEFGKHVEPVYDRLAVFLRSLARNGFIAYKEKQHLP